MKRFIFLLIASLALLVNQAATGNVCFDSDVGYDVGVSFIPVVYTDVYSGAVIASVYSDVYLGYAGPISQVVQQNYVSNDVFLEAYCNPDYGLIIANSKTNEDIPGYIRLLESINQLGDKNYKHPYCLSNNSPEPRARHV